MREPPNISRERLRACLRDDYALATLALDFLPRGHDYQAGVYRVLGEQGAVYLLKVSARPLYTPGCVVPRYLHDHGITAVVAPVPTTDGALWARLDDWTVLVYPFHEGDTRLTSMTPEHWRETGRIFQRIHQAPLPPAGFASMRREAFDPSAYAAWVRAFESQHLHAPPAGSPSAHALCAAWSAHQPTIHAFLSAMDRLAIDLRARALPAVICHADLHPANLIRDAAGHVFVIDWDEVMLAPKERDFIFIRPPYANGFWDGYGQREIDWLALTYFRYERVVQDLIENARDVCVRDDLSEDTRADLARAFATTFAPSGNVAAAYAAAAHLPPALHLSDPAYDDGTWNGDPDERS